MASPLPCLRAALAAYLDRVHLQDRSQLTTTTLQFQEGPRVGNVQVKWWRARSMLLLKTIELAPVGAEPKNVVTAAARRLLDDTAAGAWGLSVVRMDAVMDEELLDKLASRGWSVAPDSPDSADLR